MTRLHAVAKGRTFPTARLFWTCWLIYAVHWAPFMIREQFPAITLATAGTLNVDRFAGWTEDIFRVGNNGRAFINNNPGASILGAIPLVVARPILDAIERWNDALPASYVRAANAAHFEASAAVRARREWYIMAVAFVTAAGVMATTSSLVVTALGRTLWASGVPRRLALAASLSLGFATPIFVRTSYLNHNLLVCHAGLLAALMIWYRGRPQLSARRAAFAGSLGGFAVLCDYSGVLVLGAAGIYTWLRSGDGGGRQARVRSVLFYAAGAFPMLLALALYQRWAFGNPALPSQQLMPAIEETARGYRGMSWPSLEILMMNFFDRRFGLFAVCPLLALGLAAPLVPRGRFRMPDRERWLALVFFGAFTLFCASNQYSRLQWTTGLRYLVPVVPGLLLLSLEVVQHFPARIQRLLMTFSGWS